MFAIFFFKYVFYFFRYVTSSTTKNVTISVSDLQKTNKKTSNQKNFEPKKIEHKFGTWRKKTNLWILELKNLQRVFFFSSIKLPKNPRPKKNFQKTTKKLRPPQPPSLTYKKHTQKTRSKNVTVMLLHSARLSIFFFFFK